MQEKINLTGKKILITDDNFTNIKFLEKILAKAGYKTTSAVNGNECIQMTRSKKSDLILLDIGMPEMSGIQVCRTLRKDNQYVETPIIFVTAKTDDSTLNEAFEAGGSDYVRKPVNRIELLARVKSALLKQEMTGKIIDDEKLKGALEMAGSICHELNQPLQYIYGTLQLLLMDIQENDPMHESLSKMEQQTIKIGDITKKLMGITAFKTRDYVGGSKIVDIHGS